MTTATTLPSSSSPSQDYYYSNFKNSIKASETLQSYNYRLDNYMKYRNNTEHSQLIESKDIKVIENEVIEFLVYLKEKGYSLGSQGYLNAINHFYETSSKNLTL